MYFLKKALCKKGDIPLLLLILIVGGTFLFQACNTNSNANSNGKGTVTASMTDSPGTFTALNVQVIRIEAHKTSVSDSTSGWVTICDSTVNVNIMDLTNGKTHLLGSNNIDAGTYDQIRMILGTNNTVTMGGMTYPITIPSGTQTGIKINTNMTINAGENFNLLLDFNAAQSVHMTGNGNFMLKPVIHAVEVQTQGDLSGTILPASAKPVVYAINGQDTVSSAFADTSTGAFKIVGLTADTYNIAFHTNSTAYRDTTVAGVQINAGSETKLGTINFPAK